MLINLACNNIKKKFNNYAAYFLSSSFSVFVLYLFLSIIYNDMVNKQLGSLKSLMVLFAIGAVLITLFTMFFIWYSNSFFIKSRKKEFATYMLLGMTKKQTARMNFIENLMIFLFAFLAGIAAGLLLNKLFVMMLLSLMKMKGDVPFTVNQKAILICAVIYVVTFLLISLHSSAMIRRQSLIELINASKKAEKGLSVSLLTVIIGILAVLFLAFGYYQATLITVYLTHVLETIISVCIGTVLLFTGFVSVLIFIAKKREKSLYHGTKLISVSQLYHRYKGNVGTMSVIAITTSVALCAILALCGVYTKGTELAHKQNPFSVEYVSCNGADARFASIQKRHSEAKISAKVTLHPLTVKGLDPNFGDIENYLVIPESEFSAVNAAQKSNRKINLENDSDCYFVQQSGDKDATKKSVELRVSDKTIPLRVVGDDSNNYIAISHLSQTLVVRDSLYNRIKSSAQGYAIACYNVANEAAATSFEAELQNNMPNSSSILTYYDEINSLFKILGAMMFIGAFIGLLFLLATCSILYFKVSIEAHEDKQKFAILVKIGVRRNEMRAGVSKELAVIFGVPFVVAAINTFAALTPIQNVMNIGAITGAYLIVLLIYALFYGVFYLISVNSYLKTVAGQ